MNDIVTPMRPNPFRCGGDYGTPHRRVPKC